MASSESASFYDQVRLALNNFNDAGWLGAHSPLAAPYFLGEALRHPKDGPAQSRGEILQRELVLAADSLWPGTLPEDRAALETAVNEERLQQGNKGAMYRYLLLELRYFRRYFRPRADPQAKQEADIRDYLGVGRGTYFTHLKTARQKLGDALLTRLRPSFRLEQPVQRYGTLVARDNLIRQILADLKAGQTVALSGMGGAGKTALGAAVAEHWAAQPVFWYTIRPTFNDRLSSLLFSLGTYLHQQGASGLWRQLVADKGKIENYDLALAQLRGDLESLAHSALLCFDETDQLQAEAEKLTGDQIQIRELLESLRGLVPLLLIGQQQVLAADSHYRVPGLTLPEVGAFLTEMGEPFEAGHIHQLHAYTGGNPRLLKLCAALIDGERSIADIVSERPDAPAFQALLDRFWRRLSADECGILLRLAVFRSPAPEDAWPEMEEALGRMARQHIAQRDGYGGVSLLPIIRDLLYDDGYGGRFPAELRDQYHLEAAQIRAARGEYTDAAFHYQQAGEAALAVQVWYPHREQEIRRGQGAAAHVVFQRMSSRRLAEAERQALALIRAGLYELSGEVDKGLAELEAVKWPTDSTATADATLLRGYFLNYLGRPLEALDTYEEGIKALVQQLRQLARFRGRRALIYVQQRQMEEAWDEALLAQYEADHLMGIVREEQGRPEEARRSYERALELAKSLNYEEGAARTSRELAITLSKQGKTEEAMAYALEALAYFERTGDRFGLAKIQNIVTGIHFAAGEYEESIEVAEEALPFFDAVGMPYWASSTAVTLAEAYFDFGDLEKAEEAAYKVLGYEEPQNIPYALYTLGRVQHGRGDLVGGERYFQNSLDISQENGDNFMAAYAWQALGKVYGDQGRGEESRKALTTALELFERLGVTPEIMNTRGLLVSVSSKQ